MSMQNVGSPRDSPLNAAEAQVVTHIPGDEGWPLIGKNAGGVLADPKGQVERMHANMGPVYPQATCRGTSINLLGPEANELAAFDQAKQFSLDSCWG